MGWLAEFEPSKNDITDTEGTRDTARESTDTEMAQCADSTLMISSDQEKLHLEALAREQDRAMSRALKEVQDRHMEEMEAMASTTTCGRSDGCSFHLKRRNVSQEEDIKRT